MTSSFESRNHNGIKVAKGSTVRCRSAAPCQPHSTRQEFYFSDVNAVQYVYDIVEVDGIKLPSKRMAYQADADNKAILEQVMVAIDITDIQFR